MIDSNTFLKFINEPQALSLNDIMLLENVTKKHPFFNIGYSLIAKGIHTKAPEIATDAIKKAATYALSRNALRKIIENEIDWVSTVSAKISETKKEFEVSQTIENELIRERFEDELIAAIAQPKNKNIQEEQLVIIENFIKNEPRISKFSQQSQPQEEFADLSEKSTRLESPLHTESYAKILLLQGKFDASIEVYQHLMRKYPEKSTYFASKIDELKKKILNS